MNDIAIRIENLSKRYRITAALEAGQKKKSGLVSFFGDSLNYVRDTFRPPSEEETLWALKNVSLEVKRGETVGIIGQNGAGKSTLLKVISRITEPTEGRIEIYGRASSLLEVGTGFHPDLTGRENVYINGMMLGMTQEEIDRNFDEIVEFSDVGKFIDTPVKYYSSGMYVRLGFSVVAHLNPDILIVDEVLAVGDEAFKKKSLGKMDALADTGRTILFVSHNLPSIVTMCERCIWLENGKLITDGPSFEITQEYLEKTTPQVNNEVDIRNAERYGNGRARFTSLDITPVDKNGEKSAIMQTGFDLDVETTIECYEEISEAIVAIVVYDSTGFRVIDANIALKDEFLSLMQGQKAKVQFRFHNMLLKPGTYRIGLWLGRPNVYDIDGITYAKEFHVDFDPKVTKSSISYPGIYQCHFSEKIEVL